MKVSTTGPEVVLTSTASAPVSDTEGTARVMVPVIRPASPVGPSSSTAAPLVTESTGVAPPSARLTLLIARRTVWVSASGPVPPGTPLAPYEVDRSTTRSPRRLWPSTVSTMPVPSKRTYGPALTSRATAVPPTSTLAVTGSVVVLTARVRAPVSVVPAGRVTTRVPEMRPATPAAVTSRRPLPPVIRTPLPPAPMLRSTRFRPIVVTVAPPTVARSSTTSAVRVWPWTVTVSPLPATRRYGPAGRSSTRVAPATSTLVETGAAIELMLTLRPDPMLMPGTVTWIWALSRPAMPAGVSSSTPEPWVTETVLPRLTLTALAATTTSSPRLANEKVPVSDCPPKASVAPVATISSTGAAVVNVTATGGAPPGISSDSSMTRPVVLTRAETVPVRVTPATPMMLTVPEAVSAHVEPIRIRPIRPFVSSTPVASGLVSPVSSLAGPRPRKMVSPSPANTCAA